MLSDETFTPRTSAFPSAGKRERPIIRTLDAARTANNGAVRGGLNRFGCARERLMSEGGVIGALARQIQAGSCALSAWIGINDPAVPEQLAREGYDTVTLDMQHGAIDISGAMRGIGAVALAGKPAIVRIPVGEFATASRVIDAGAAAVIAPMINSGADARRFVDFMKYPPIGQRSWGPRAALTHSGLIGPAYLHGANAITLAIAMVETAEAFDAIDEILTTPGIDGIFIGPSDLSIALHRGAIVDPHGADVDAAFTKAVARAKAHGKFAAGFCFDGKRARELAGRGYSLCSVSTDALLLRTAARAEIAAARA
jgi:4-hydroxy-2-oxoheptanedioate aldolase